MKFDPLTFGMEVNTFAIKALHKLSYYVTLCSIYQILHFKHHKNINFENSYIIEILFKWNDSSLLLEKIQ